MAELHKTDGSYAWTRTFPYPARCSGLKSADATIKSGKTVLAAVLVLTDGSNDATLTIYDNTSASGTKLLEVTVPAADRYALFPLWVRANNGLYADISGTGAQYIVYYV